mgnify:CR=1 FL=1
MRVTYKSRDSGGDWWLSDQDWLALEQAGWDVCWVKDDPRYQGETRWRGTVAKRASIDAPSLEAAIVNWTQTTGRDPNTRGCECCGQPHNFECE